MTLLSGHCGKPAARVGADADAAPPPLAQSETVIGANDLRKVSWRRESAPQEYAGYLALARGLVRLLGREEATGIHVALTIPHAAVLAVTATGETLVIDVADGVPLLVRPAGGKLELAALARRLDAALAAAPLRAASIAE